MYNIQDGSWFFGDAQASKGGGGWVGNNPYSSSSTLTQCTRYINVNKPSKTSEGALVADIDLIIMKVSVFR
jgi:hypothetical protein